MANPDWKHPHWYPNSDKPNWHSCDAKSWAHLEEQKMKSKQNNPLIKHRRRITILAVASLVILFLLFFVSFPLLK